MKFYYREENQSIEIIRCFGCDGKVVLPECIDGLPVEKVAAYTFSDRRDSEDREFLVYETEDHTLFKGEEELLAGGMWKKSFFRIRCGKSVIIYFMAAKNCESWNSPMRWYGSAAALLPAAGDWPS